MNQRQLTISIWPYRPILVSCSFNPKTRLEIIRFFLYARTNQVLIPKRRTNKNGLIEIAVPKGEASPDFIAEIEGLGEKFRLYRSIHRKLHLDPIEEFLSDKDKC